MKRNNHFIISGFIVIFFTTVFSSCYSVVLVNKKGVPIADPLNNDIGFYNGKEVHKIDTTVKINITKNQVFFMEGCPEGGFYSVEYRASLGGVLLSGITLGKVRKVKAKYTCIKQSN